MGDAAAVQKLEVPDLRWVSKYVGIIRIDQPDKERIWPQLSQKAELRSCGAEFQYNTGDGVQEQVSIV